MKRTILLITLCLLFLSSCSDEKKLEGSWSGTSSGYDFSLDLNEDGTFELSRSFYSTSGTWEVPEEETITCTVNGYSGDYTYFLDGDELWIDAFLGLGDFSFTRD